MTMHFSPDDLKRQLADLISVRSSGSDVEAEMPLVYPGGETVVITISQDGADYLVHDAGLGSMCLSSYGINITKNMAAKLAKIAEQYGCTFANGRMSRRSTRDNLALSVAIVANASRSIGDQTLYASNPPIIDFKTEALEILRSSVGSARVRENEPTMGESGSKYLASAAILASDGVTAISLVEPVRDHDAATKKFREFWDVSKHAAYAHLDRYALYDDRKDWQASDLNLLQNVCTVVRLSDTKSLLS